MPPPNPRHVQHWSEAGDESRGLGPGGQPCCRWPVPKTGIRCLHILIHSLMPGQGLRDVQKIFPHEISYRRGRHGTPGSVLLSVSCFSSWRLGPPHRPS